MPNWCDNKLVLTGTEPELDAFLRAVSGKAAPQPHGADSAHPVPAAPDEPVPEPEPGPLNFRWLAPEPPHVSHTSRSHAWRLTYWGTKWEPDAEHTTVEAEPCSTIFHFTTPWGPPDAIALRAAALFPSLGFALHGCEPGNGVYSTLLAHADGRVETIAYEEPAEQAEFLDQLFGYDFETDDDIEIEAPAQPIEIRHQATPFGTDITSVLWELAAARTAAAVRRCAEKLAATGAPAATVATLLAGHASVYDDELAAAVLAHDRAVERALLGHTVAPGLVRPLTDWAVQRLDVPPPELPASSGRASVSSAIGPAVGDELGDVVAALLAARLDADRGLEPAMPRPQPAELAGRVISCLVAQAALDARSPDVRRLLARYRATDAADPSAHRHRQILAAALIGIESLRGADVRSLASSSGPPHTSRFDQLVAGHPNVPAAVLAKLILDGVDAAAVLRALTHARSRSFVSVRRAILAAPAMHPAVHLELARDAGPAEFADIAARMLDARADGSGAHHVLAAIDRATPDQCAALPAELWQRLLSHPQATIRERAVLALGHGRRPGGAARPTG